MRPNVKNKIALFVGTLSGGGAQRVILNIAGGFARQGLEVDLVLANRKGSFLDAIPPGVQVINLQASRVLTSIPRLVSYMREEKPAAMLSTMYHANLAALIARRVSCVQTRIFVRVETTVSRWVDMADWRIRLVKYLIRYLYPLASGIIAPSHGVADDLVRNIRLPSKLIHIIYNPVDRAELLERTTEILFHPWFMEGQPPVILSVGRLSKAKDYPTLIRAFALALDHQVAHLMILGEGEERNKLEILVKQLAIEKYVSLPGFVKNPYAYMKRASVFVLSSIWEGLPNALIEAITVGIPVIATDCKSGPREILDGGKYGKLVPVGDENKLAAGIMDLIQNRSSATPSKEWLKNFSQEECINRYMETIQVKALNKHS